MPNKPGFHTLRWSPKYELGIDILDRQHKAFLEILNDFQERIDHAEPFSALNRKHALKLYSFISRARAYAFHHFCTEEDYMLRAKCKDFIRQKRRHNEFMRQIMDMEDKVFAGETGFSIKLKRFMESWWLEHILREDMCLKGLDYAPSLADLAEMAVNMQVAGRLDDALYLYGKAIDLGPSESYLYYNRAMILDFLGQYEHALEDLAKAASLGDEDALRLLESRKINLDTA